VYVCIFTNYLPKNTDAGGFLSCGDYILRKLGDETGFRDVFT